MLVKLLQILHLVMLNENCVCRESKMAGCKFGDQRVPGLHEGDKQAMNGR